MRAVACALAIALTVAAGELRANVAASSRAAGPGGAVAVTPGTPLVVEREVLEITCSEDGCRFRAAYSIVNPTAERVTALAVFWGAGRRIELELPGRRARSLPDAELDAVVRAHARLEQPPESAPVPHPEGLDLDLAAGSRVELVARGELDTGWERHRGYVIEPVYARHHLVQPSRTASDAVVASYYLSPIRSFRAAGPITLVVRAPGHWDATLQLETTDGSRVPVTLDASGRATIAPERARMLHLSFDRTRRFHAGGPLVGIGGAFGGSGRGLRLRAGWELAAPSWLFWGATAETNASDLLVVTPSVEVASDQVLILPSVGLGLGAPVRIEPDGAVGVRIQGTVAVSKLGLVGVLDHFPTEGETIFSLLGQVWL